MTGIEETGPVSGGGLGWMPIAVTFIIISAALGGIMIVGELNEPDLEPMTITAIVKVNYGNGTTLTEEITTGNYTAFGFLEAFVGFGKINATYYEMFESWLINEINGIGNGDEVAGIPDTGNYYWQYYVNEVLGPVGADRYALLDGDVVEWRFEEMVW